MKINKLQYCISFGLVFFMLISKVGYSQDKEYDKLKGMVDKGKLDKAQEYCDKVTESMAPKKAARLFGLMALGYYNNKDYTNAAEMVLKSTDKKLSLKLGRELEKSDQEYYDIDMAIKLFIHAKEEAHAAELLFNQGKYEESAKACPSADCGLKYGSQLFDEGKIDESLYYFKRAKRKGQKFTEEKVLDYYYNKKAYSIAYAIQDFGEGNFDMNIQGSVIEKMFENDEPMPFVKHFLDSLNIKSNKQDEVIVQAMVNTKQFDKAENYCMELKQPNQQIALTYMAEVAGSKYPQASARANYKLGKTYLAKNQLTDYLIETAKENNDKWESDPIDKKLIEVYQKETKDQVKKCGQDYCELIKHAEKMSAFKASEQAKTNKQKAEEYTKAGSFLKQVVQATCK